MWRWLIPLAVACAVALALVWAGQRQTAHLTIATTNPGADPTTPGFVKPCGWKGAPPATYKHVIWIMFGTRGYKDVTAKHNGARYLHQLVSQCGLATEYWSITHPELPNVMASVTGTTAGFPRNKCPGCRSYAPNLFKQVPSWAVYMASMPSPCHTTDAIQDHYLVRMNPAAYLPLPGCRLNDLPLGDSRGPFATRLRTGKLPAFTLVVPNECYDMSFSKDCAARKVGEFVYLGDTWLQGIMRRILRSPAYRARTTAVLITWAEGSPAKPLGVDCLARPVASCHVATVVVAPTVKPGATDATKLSHYSLLKTTEMMLGIKRYLGGARAANGMRAAFNL